jgi:hypothetical protein
MSTPWSRMHWANLSSASRRSFGLAPLDPLEPFVVVPPVSVNDATPFESPLPPQAAATSVNATASAPTAVPRTSFRLMCLPSSGSWLNQHESGDT